MSSENSLLSYFQLFSLPPAFAIDAALLRKNFRTLQRQFHPDKFVHLASAEQRVALQYATLINEAYACLSSDIARAAYLLDQAGWDNSQPAALDSAFLFEQMHWREALSEAHTAAQLQPLRSETDAAWAQCKVQFAEVLAEENYSAAAQMFNKMQFVSKFQAELSLREESL